MFIPLSSLPRCNYVRRIILIDGNYFLNVSAYEQIRFTKCFISELKIFFTVYFANNIIYIIKICNFRETWSHKDMPCLNPFNYFVYNSLSNNVEANSILDYFQLIWVWMGFTMSGYGSVNDLSVLWTFVRFSNKVSKYFSCFDSDADFGSCNMNENPKSFSRANKVKSLEEVWKKCCLERWSWIFG